MSLILLNASIKNKRNRCLFIGTNIIYIELAAICEF